MKLSIQTGTNNTILRTPSRPVLSVDKNIGKFMEKMVASMKEENGVGLAAPQVGKNERMIVVKIFQPNGTAFSIVQMVNPVIEWFSPEKEVDIEGCLSIPGKYGKVERSKGIKMSYVNKKFIQQKLDLSGLNARIVQHEVDHLDGILFVDKVIEMVQLDEEQEVRI